jgi:aminoglycoside/choline kinase family phosphotransferase
MPTTIDDPVLVDPGWLTDVLRADGVLPADRRVAAATTAPVDGGNVAHTVRLSLEYDAPVPQAPASLVAKFPARSEPARNLASLQGFYRREVRFYRELASRLRMRVPRCHAARLYDGDGFVLLLEDIADGVVYDQTDGCPDDDALLAVGQLALLHASHWNDPALAAMGWLNQLHGPDLRVWEDLFRASWISYVARDEVIIDRELLSLGNLLCDSSFQHWIGGYRGPRALIHADFHLTNLLFRDPPSGGREVVTVDWQLATHAPPLIDVAYFLGRMEPTARRRVERDLVRAYHERLQWAGVGDYGWADCWADYQRWAWFGVVSSLLAVAVTPMSAEEAHRYAAKVSRYLTQALDHDSARFLLDG